MKPNWIWWLLFGFVLGVASGFFFSARLNRAAMPKGTSLLREFSLITVLAKAGQTNWQIIEDRTYEPFPALARSKRIARRIVARAELSDAELDWFTTGFQQAASEALVSYNARNTAQFDLVQGSERVVEGSPIRSRVDLPRRYYAIGDIHGVADIWYIAESGRVTLMASFIEGP
jgi:hypothetical protein